MRIVVVGATGNVGTAVIDRLRTAPEVTEIVGVARRLPDATVPPYDAATWHGIDVSESNAVRRLTLAFAGADAVIHLAWLLQPNHDRQVMEATNIGGLAHVLAAVEAAAVPQIVVASSVGAYSPGPKRRAVDESWPTGGVVTSQYARQKAATERLLDEFEAAQPTVVVTRLRPGLVMQARAGAELKRLFLGPLIPIGWLNRVHLPAVPLPTRCISQVVHADDLADAFLRSVLRRAAGAFNIAAGPVIGPREVATVLGTRWLRVRTPPIRALLDVAWRLRLVRADPGWLDLATAIPVMSTERAERELDWHPRIGALTALREVVDAVADHVDVPSSPALVREGRPAR